MTREFTANGWLFRICPVVGAGFRLEQWTSLRSVWLQVGLFPSKSEARRYARTRI